MSRDRDRERSNERDGGRERKPAPSVDGLYTLKIDNISFKTTADVLRDEFSRYGDLGDVYLPRNYSTNEPRGFAFVRFTNRLDGEDALREMDGRMVDGRELRIQEAKERRAENPKEAMISRGGYQGNRDRGGGRDYGGDRGGYRDSYRPREEYRDNGRGRDRSRDRGDYGGRREEYGRERDYSPPRGGGGYGRDRSPVRDRSPPARRRSRSRDSGPSGGADDRY